MEYTVIGEPRIEREYSDRWEAVMVIDLQREDGETGDVWIVAGVPDSQRGSSEAARTVTGYESVRVFGDSPAMWCPASFDYRDHNAILAACEDAALKAWRGWEPDEEDEEEAETE